MRVMQSCTLAYNDKSHIRFLLALSNEFIVGIEIITDILKDFSLEILSVRVCNSLSATQ